MFINSSEQRIDGLSQFAMQIQFIPNQQNQNNPSNQDSSSYNSMKQLMQIDQQSLVIKIGKLMHELINTKQKLFLYEDLCGKLRKQNEQSEIKIKDLQSKLNQKNHQFKQKLDIIQQKQQIISKLTNEKQKTNNELAKFEQKFLKIKQQKSEQNESKYKKKMKQLIRINELLQKQLRISNSKIIEYEKKIQDKTCTQFVVEMNRIRQNSLRSTTIHLQSTQKRLKTQMTPLRQHNYIINPSLNRMRAISSKGYRF